MMQATRHYPPQQHLPPLEQGGVSHRSSLPQQVEPCVRWALTMRAAEGSLSIRSPWQEGQRTGVDPASRTSSSTTWPQSAHR